MVLGIRSETDSLLRPRLIREPRPRSRLIDPREVANRRVGLVQPRAESTRAIFTIIGSQFRRQGGPPRCFRVARHPGGIQLESLNAAGFPETLSLLREFFAVAIAKGRLFSGDVRLARLAACPMFRLVPCALPSANPLARPTIVTCSLRAAIVTERPRRPHPLEPAYRQQICIGSSFDKSDHSVMKDLIVQ